MGITTVPNFEPVDTTTRLTALEGGTATRDYMDLARAAMSTNGVRSVDYATLAVSWVNRILVMGAGQAGALAPSGEFDITTPPAGTVVPRVGATGATTVTATAAGVPLNAFDSLYYIVPLGSTLTSLPANFRVVGYDAPFTVPHTWLRIATRLGDGAVASIQWFDGMNQSPWVPATLINSWVQYAGFAAAGYRKVNGIVYLKGLIQSGTAAASFVLPVGFRPAETRIFTGHAGGGHERIDIGLAGSVLHGGYYAAGTNAYVALDHINFPAEV